MLVRFEPSIHVTVLFFSLMNLLQILPFLLGNRYTIRQEQ